MLFSSNLGIVEFRPFRQSFGRPSLVVLTDETDARWWNVGVRAMNMDKNTCWRMDIVVVENGYNEQKQRKRR